jgi:hypothetical protein
MSVKAPYANSWCKRCRVLVQARSDQRIPVGVECPECKQFCPRYSSSSGPLKGVVIGEPLYIDQEQTK